MSDLHYPSITPQEFKQACQDLQNAYSICESRSDWENLVFTGDQLRICQTPTSSEFAHTPVSNIDEAHSELEDVDSVRALSSTWLKSVSTDDWRC